VAGDCLKWKRRIDQAARIGGEEFALMLPETDERGAFIVAERLRRATHRTFADAAVRVTISFGVATSPLHGADAVGLLRAADRAVAAAKELGSDRTVIYSDEVARTLAEPGPHGDGQLQLATVIGLAEALDIRDTGTGEHSHTVGRYAEMMARELDLGEDHVERVRLAGVLHDIGKIGISDRVLSKPGPLDADEWQEMFTHPEIGARLLTRPEFDDLRGWILAHHERPDGAGYPHGLSGDEIPLEARILAVADAYEAMTADRVYRPALGAEAARAELSAGSGSQFDARVVSAFVRALDAGRARALRVA
jgi:putative nucleotidyltransferase with HDIG domain